MAARLARRVGAPCALLLAALGAPQAPSDGIDAGVPAAQSSQRMRLSVTFVITGGTFEDESVLA